MKMKLAMGLSLLLNVGLASDHYSITELYTNSAILDVNEKDLMTCVETDHSRNLISQCYYWKSFKKHSFSLDGRDILMKNKKDESVIIGSLEEDGRDYYLDNVHQGGLAKKAILENDQNITVKVTNKKVSKLNSIFGCHGVFDCDFRIFVKVTRYYLQLEKNGKTLEKVKLQSL